MESPPQRFSLRGLSLIALVVGLLCALLLFALPAEASRLKDIARWKGIEENQVIGIGVVVGLQGTGDLGQGAQNMLSNAIAALQVDLDPTTLKSKNAAVVMVTSTLPAFARRGDKVDVTISSIGDARSLFGGTLLLTPLQDSGGRAVWAVAQGSLTLGGYAASGGGTSRVKNHTTTGRIPAGAKLVQDLAPDFLNREVLRLSLRERDFHTVVAVARAINKELLGDFAHAIDNGTVEVAVPPQYLGRVPEVVARLESLDIEVDRVAKVVVNERTGTVVMGSNVRIGKVAVSHGALTIEVSTRQEVSQPAPFSDGKTVITDEGAISIDEETPELQVLEGVSIGEVVSGLNQLGVGPRDLISILQAIREAGALDAEIEVL